MTGYVTDRSLREDCKNESSPGRILCRRKSYIQPFERELALWELRALTADEPRLVQSPDIFEVISLLSAEELADRLSYWESLRDSDSPQSFISRQVAREATTYLTREILEIYSLDPQQRELQLELKAVGTLPNRRCLRYGPHGLHEYRGKFFPQLVRSLINAAEVPKSGIVADPMSGSGTTAVEAVLMGRSALGLDMNPLSVFMARVKCETLKLSPDELASAFFKIRDELQSARAVTVSYFASLPEHDQQYLGGWFSADVLAQLDRIMDAIGRIGMPLLSGTLRLCLSNILRSVSWQKDDDLRVRKIVVPDFSPDVISIFLDEVERSFRVLLAFNNYNVGYPIGHFSVQAGDARQLNHHWKEHRGCIDAVITSPPYATALPYLDTDRLSLCYLGLLPRGEHRSHDSLMIGNREISDKECRRAWEEFLNKRHELPDSISKLIERIYDLNNDPLKEKVGFRRRNLPSLLWAYFTSMKSVLKGVAQMLRPGAIAYFVVGDNHTIAGGEKVIIDTPRLLCELADSVGLQVETPLSMELLVSRDIFRQNRGASEWVLPFRRQSK